MAITAVGSLGSANDKNSGTVTLAMNPSSNVSAGAIVVVWVAWDSVFSIFAPSDATGTYKVSDSAGNVYTCIVGETDQQAFFASGAYVGLYVSQLDYALLTTDTIDVLSTHVGNLIAKSMSAYEFSIAAGKRWAYAADRTRQHIGAADPPSISVDGEDTREWLFLHGLGVEGPNTDAYTWDGAWTQITGDGTTGGAADSNIHIRGGFLIDDGPTATIDVTSTTADRDATQILTAITEVPGRSFPNTPILDNFNRADESPLAGGLWNTTDHALGSTFAQIIGNAATGNGGSFWATTPIAGTCQECYFTIATHSGGGSSLYLRAGGESGGGGPNMHGYGAGWDPAPGDGVDQYLKFGVAGNQGGIVGERLVWVDGFNGCKLGLQLVQGQGVIPGIIHLWIDIGAGWQEVCASCLPSSAMFTGTFALSSNSSTPRIDDFGGGDFPCAKSRPQFYRRPFG